MLLRDAMFLPISEKSDVNDTCTIVPPFSWPANPVNTVASPVSLTLPARPYKKITTVVKSSPLLVKLAEQELNPANQKCVWFWHLMIENNLNGQINRQSYDSFTTTWNKFCCQPKPGFNSLERTFLILHNRGNKKDRYIWHMWSKVVILQHITI